jgi:hypothetical protein
MATKSLHTPYRSSQLAIDARRAADAGPQSTMEKYEAQRVRQRDQAEREWLAFWRVSDDLVNGRPVNDDHLRLANACIDRHADNDPPTLRWAQLPDYHAARLRIRRAARMRSLAFEPER